MNLLRCLKASLKMSGIPLLLFKALKKVDFSALEPLPIFMLASIPPSMVEREPICGQETSACEKAYLVLQG